MHKILKHYYLDEKIFQRLDPELEAIINQTRDKVFDRYIKCYKEKLTQK